MRARSGQGSDGRSRKKQGGKRTLSIVSGPFSSARFSCSRPQITSSMTICRHFPEPKVHMNTVSKAKSGAKRTSCMSAPFCSFVFFATFVKDTASRQQLIRSVFETFWETTNRALTSWILASLQEGEVASSSVQQVTVQLDSAREDQNLKHMQPKSQILSRQSKFLRSPPLQLLILSIVSPLLFTPHLPIHYTAGLIILRLDGAPLQAEE